MPVRATPQAAGFDVTAVDSVLIPPRSQRLVKTGIAIACPTGTYARVAPRSGPAVKHSIGIGAGVVDADYRGEVAILVINHGDRPF